MRSVNRALGPRNGPAWTLSLHQWVYRRTGGRLGHGLIGLPTLLLTVPGRRTGAPRTVCVVYDWDGTTFVVSSGLPGKTGRIPAWVGNVRAHPDVALHVWRDHLTARAHIIDSQDPDYAQAWSRVVALNPRRFNGYRAAADRPLPVVVLEPMQAS
jgi:deazaflavin-dependent oxidoreductase (nitroreductase family)